MTGSDTTTYWAAPEKAVLVNQEQWNKMKYLERCIEMRQEYTALVYSVNWITEGGAREEDKRLKLLLSNK